MTRFACDFCRRHWPRATDANPYCSPRCAFAAHPDLQTWLADIQRREAVWVRAANAVYQRYDRDARRLTPDIIRRCCDLSTVQQVEQMLRAVRHVGSGFQRLDRIWTGAELGVLVTEATNRVRQLVNGPRRPQGPHLDPALIPDDRLELLIQRHRDMAVVDACRAERERRAAQRKAAA